MMIDQMNVVLYINANLLAYTMENNTKMGQEYLRVDVSKNFADVMMKHVALTKKMKLSVLAHLQNHASTITRSILDQFQPKEDVAPLIDAIVNAEYMETHIMIPLMERTTHSRESARIPW